MKALCSAVPNGEVMDERNLAVYNLHGAERDTMIQIMQQQWDLLDKTLTRGSSYQASLAGTSSRPVEASKVGRAIWGPIVRKETVLLCRGTNLGSGSNDEFHFKVPHRIYVQQGKGELRVATAIVTTDI